MKLVEVKLADKYIENSMEYCINTWKGLNMYAIVIGASDETIYAIRQAQNYGMKVLAFDGNKNAEGLKYADEAYVVDIRNPKKIYEVIDKKNIPANDMIVLPVPIGRYLISTGAFNEHYGLIGVKKTQQRFVLTNGFFTKL